MPDEVIAHGEVLLDEFVLVRFRVSASKKSLYGRPCSAAESVIAGLEVANNEGEAGWDDYEVYPCQTR